MTPFFMITPRLSTTPRSALGIYLNRLPTVTIREGHRVKVYLTSDLELPAYEAPQSGNRPLLARTR